MNDLDDFNMDDWVQEEVVIPENLLDDSLFPGAPFNAYFPGDTNLTKYSCVAN